MLRQRNSKLKSQVTTTTATVQSVQTFWKTKTVNCDTLCQHSPSHQSQFVRLHYHLTSHYISFAFQSVTAQSHKPKHNRKLSKWKTKYTVTVVILCEIGGSDSGGAAAEPEPHLLGCNAVSLGEQFRKC